MWIQTFNELFIGFDAVGTVHRQLGDIATSPLAGAQLEGETWETLVTQYAAHQAQAGLRHVWDAVAGQHVAPEYWPPYLPFHNGIILRLRPVADDADPDIALAAHLSRCVQPQLNALMDQHVLDATDRLVRLGRHVFRGITGPLTDLQVREVGSILNNAEFVQQMLEGVRAEVLLPASAAPLPHHLNELFDFSEHDFIDRRIETHRLAIHNELSADSVYCYDGLRDVVKRTLNGLLQGIATESAITLQDQTEDGTRVRVAICYRSTERDLRVEERIEPLALSDPERFQPMRPVERIVSTLHAYSQPVGGRAWAAPGAEEASACILCELPRWQAK
jgi:hypothetical protein